MEQRSLFHLFNTSSCADSLHLRRNLGNVFWRWAVEVAVVVDVAVNVHREPVSGSFVAAATHAMEGTISLQTLKLVLKDISASVAALYQQDVAVGHLIQKLSAVSANLAHYFLVEVVGGWAFFDRRPFVSGFMSGFTTSGTVYHSTRSMMTVVSSSLISCGVAS